MFNRTLRDAGRNDLNLLANGPVIRNGVVPKPTRRPGIVSPRILVNLSVVSLFQVAACMYQVLSMKAPQAGATNTDKSIEPCRHIAWRCADKTGLHFSRKSMIGTAAREKAPNA